MIYLSNLSLRHKTLKVAFALEAVFPESKGGLERWYGVLTKFLATSGHEVFYLNAQNVNEVRDGVTYISILKQDWSYLARGKRSKLQAFRFAEAIRKWIYHNNLDVIYISSVPILSIFAASYACKKKNILLIVEWFEIWKLSYWISYTGYVFGFIGWVIQSISLQLGKQIVVFTDFIYNRASKIRFKKLTISKMPGLCSTHLIQSNFNSKIRQDIISIGRLVEEKQPMLALRAIENYIDAGWSGVFWIIGTGPLSSEINAYINQSTNAKQIKFIENANDGIISDLLRRSFALLHPSRREGYGLALVEAAYMGTPAIMIKYPENASTELEINPTLICANDKVSTIVERLDFAYKNQLKLRKDTKRWAIDATFARSYTKSCQLIDGMIKNIKGIDKLGV